MKPLKQAENLLMILGSDSHAIVGHREAQCGPPVGLLPQATYDSGQIDLRPGDLLTLFTDGISETMNAADEEWGEGRLIEALTNCAGISPVEVVQAIFADADSFAAGVPQHDDMTLVVFRVLG